MRVEEFFPPELVARCQKLRKLIAAVSQTKEGQNVYGAMYHHYQLTPPLSLEEVCAYEEKHHITLPIEYRAYITLVARGGAGPGNGYIYGFPKEAEGYEEFLSIPSPELDSNMTAEEWKALYGDSTEEEECENENGNCEKNTDEDTQDIQEDTGEKEYIPRDAGTFALTGMDTCYLAHLIVTGKEKGKIVYLDWDSEYPPIWPKSCSNFLDWCENWFQELLAGYRINAGNFMYYEVGDEIALMKSFMRNENPRYRRGVLCSFAKFPFLEDTTIAFLKERQEGYEEIVSSIIAG